MTVSYHYYDTPSSQPSSPLQGRQNQPNKMLHTTSYQIVKWEKSYLVPDMCTGLNPEQSRKSSSKKQEKKQTYVGQR